VPLGLYIRRIPNPLANVANTSPVAGYRRHHTFGVLIGRRVETVSDTLILLTLQQKRSGTSVMEKQKISLLIITQIYILPENNRDRVVKVYA
jgi:hypothetical protein